LVAVSPCSPPSAPGDLHTHSNVCTGSVPNTSERLIPLSCFLAFLLRTTCAKLFWIQTPQTMGKLRRFCSQRINQPRNLTATFPSSTEASIFGSNPCLLPVLHFIRRRLCLPVPELTRILREAGIVFGSAGRLHRETGTHGSANQMIQQSSAAVKERPDKADHTVWWVNLVVIHAVWQRAAARERQVI
jgi:hypothetical protein